MAASDHLSPEQFRTEEGTDQTESDHQRLTGWFANDDQDHGIAGYVSHKPAADGKSTSVRTLHVDDDRRHLGVASHLMDTLASRYPTINHGERTEAGKAWYEGYKSKGGKA